MSTFSDPSLPVTIDDVARRARVAPSSVSRVLNNHPNVSPAMRQRVFAAAEALGYRPDFIAKSLRSGMTYSVGFVVRDISNPLFADIAKGAEDILRMAGYSMILTNSEGDPERDAEYISLLQQRRVDALMLAIESESHPATLDALRLFSGPLVLLDRDVPELRASAVLCDHRSGVRAAVLDLLNLGHRRIGFIAGPTTIRVTRDRLAGYVEAHSDCRVPIHDELLRFGAYTAEFGYAQTMYLLGAISPPTALVAAGIQLAGGALRACSQAGMRTGRDIAFVTCDEIELMRLFDPPISAVTRDATLLGTRAAELLLHSLLERTPPSVEHVPTHYVRRGTSVPPTMLSIRGD